MSIRNKLTEKKTVFVVLGPSRNGTSAITRGLKALGVDLGEVLHPGDSRNPKGFWEDAEILHKVNRVITKDLHYSSLNEDEWERAQADPVLNDYKNYAVKLLSKRFASTDYWGFKDPRTLTILAFWQSVFKAIDVDDRYVIAFRNPLASTHSIQRYIQSDLELGLLLWLKHLIWAIDGTHGKKRVVVCYELMLKDPRQQLERMHKGLSIPFTMKANEVDAYANEFLDKKLRHHAFSDEDLRVDPVVMVAPLCIQLYDLLMTLAKDELLFDSVEFKLAWQKIKEDFAKLQPIYNYIELLHIRNKQQERELRTIRRSLPWKIIFPLRLIDNILRALRRKVRLTKRLASIYE